MGQALEQRGIVDGNMIIVESRQTANPGQTVVALIDEEKATVKKFYPEGLNVRLKPCNPDHQPMIFSADRVRIQGVVIGIHREF